MKKLLLLSLLLVGWHAPSREAQINRLHSFDLVIIGGGATGSGIALEAAARGRSVLLVERGDFASQTSSKSTKLVHGGVRYLEKAIKKRDRQQYDLVKEALQERGTLFEMAPFAVRPLAIVTPLYKLREIPYMWTGLKIYDWIAKEASIEKSRFLSAKKIKEQFPYIKQKGLKGGVIYYDGQFNDTRLNMAVVLSAVQQGAVALNYMEATSLIKKKGVVCGVELKDKLSGEHFFVQSDVVINATGPFSDEVRKMDGAIVPRIRPSSGTHIVLDRKYVPEDAGILIPKTEDGRLLFFLPWQGMTIAGTTDHPTSCSENPRPHAEDVAYILEHVNRYLEEEVTQVHAVWTGLRPLVTDPRESSTANICRNHQVEVSDSGLISVMGGKWTTFRKMAEDAVDRAFGGQSQTATMQIIGSEGYDELAHERLAKVSGIDLETCDRLLQAYGMRAFEVVKQADQLLSAQVIWACREEYAQTIMDVMARRTRLAFLNAKQAQLLIENVADIMQDELGWSEAHKQNQIEQAHSEILSFLAD
ncbi:MAG: Aerobic glycerol-3-phosphate dehydrogenase [Chlamydiales bacterium]|nr:Aerobic glycerol-3-phosphate dehydrogenase [Chlamydiales bacterium]MCH9635359.1 Aerobic glycerol-3-phosphate dehydrogenase [Chlamydiales bacterium]MCH9704004.1 FAD-dependent oxidoreductase [Chlamydiota bacterium]